MAEHEVGQHAGRAPAHPHLAVDQNLPATVQRQVYELRHVIEVDGDVGLRDVQQAETLVGDPPRLIVILR